MALLHTFPSRRVLIGMTLLGLFVTILLRFAFARSEAQMQEAGGYGIVAYELAFTPEQADTILTAWGEVGQAGALSSLLIDFAFMPAYAMLFSGLTLLLARALSGQVAAIGRWLAAGQWVAALLDAVENLALLRLLGTQGAVPAAPPLIAGTAASLKFGLLAAALLFWLVGGIIALITLPRRKGTSQ